MTKSENIKPLEDDQFASLVIEASKTLPKTLFVIDFWAEWCGPCKMLAPLLDKIANKYTTVKFFSVDVEKTLHITEEFKIKSIPTLLFIKDGIEVDNMMGLNPEQKIVKVIEDLIA